jgi:putative holliday junction resolvase
MRLLGIDFGERRIGVAAADDRTMVAVPVTTLDVRGDPVDALARLVEDERADVLVVGLPLSLTGAEGPQAQRVREVIDALSQRLSIPIETWDERLSTRQAERRPRSSRGRGKRVGEARDAVAAAIILQSYLDSVRYRG